VIRRTLQATSALTNAAGKGHLLTTDQRGEPRPDKEDESAAIGERMNVRQTSEKQVRK